MESKWERMTGTQAGVCSSPRVTVALMAILLLSVPHAEGQPFPPTERAALFAVADVVVAIEKRDEAMAILRAARETAFRASMAEVEARRTGGAAAVRAAVRKHETEEDQDAAQSAWGIALKRLGDLQSPAFDTALEALALHRSSDAQEWHEVRVSLDEIADATNAARAAVAAVVKAMDASRIAWEVVWDQADETGRVTARSHSAAREARRLDALTTAAQQNAADAEAVVTRAWSDLLRALVSATVDDPALWQVTTVALVSDARKRAQ